MPRLYLNSELNIQLRLGTHVSIHYLQNAKIVLFRLLPSCNSLRSEIWTLVGVRVSGTSHSNQNRVLDKNAESFQYMVLLRLIVACHTLCCIGSSTIMHSHKYTLGTYVLLHVSAILVNHKTITFAFFYHSKILNDTK